MNNSIDITEVQKRIPKALYDCISERLRNDKCLSIWQYCLECIEEMADAWEEVNGKDLVWVPGHYEKKKPEKNLTAEDISRILKDSVPDIYAVNINTSTSNLEQIK